MISIRNVSIEFPGKRLFSNFNATIFPKDRIGLVGKNGSGKSTLMKAIAGVFKDFQGEINISGKVLYMDQYRTFDAKTPFEYYTKVADTPEKEKQVRSILKGLGFNEEDWYRDISTFSGGERTKLQLGRLFVEEPDFLLLDEPTNFLDIEAIEFLKRLLLSFKGGYMIISHDRDFLRSVCNKFWEINNETIWMFDMPYDRYHEERKRIIETQQRQVASLQREIQRLREIIDRYKKWGRDKFQRQAKSREKMLERMLEELENMPAIYLEEEKKKIEIPAPESSGYVVLELKNVSWKALLRNVSFTIYQGDKVALIGPNGSGKSTILKIISGELQHEGTVIFGYKVNVAYVEQFVEQLDFENTVFDEIFEEMPGQPDYVIRAYAGRFGFKGENVFKTVAELSGGERQILALAKVLLRKPNLLVLDEPTNHMDLETVEALEDALKEYKGSIILVSHDLELIRNVCNRFLSIRDGTLLEVDEPLYFTVDKGKEEKKRNIDFERRKRVKNSLKSLISKIDQLKIREREICLMIDELSRTINRTNDYLELLNLQRVKDELEAELLNIMEEIENSERMVNELKNEIKSEPNEVNW